MDVRDRTLPAFIGNTRNAARCRIVTARLLDSRRKTRGRASISQTHYRIKNSRVLSPGAGFDIRYWSNESFAAVADWMIEKFGMNVVIAGSVKDRSLAQGIQKLSKQKLYDLTGESSLDQFAALVGRASLFVGIESAGFHFAWTLGIPAVGIFGGGHFGRFTPSVPHGASFMCRWIVTAVTGIASTTKSNVSLPSRRRWSKKKIESVMNNQQFAERK